MYRQGAFRDADDEEIVGEPNIYTSDVADDGDTEVNHQQAIRDAGPQGLRTRLRMDEVRKPREFDTTSHDSTHEVEATALTLPTAPKRNQKRKVPGSEKVRSNDETATNDANNVVKAKRGSESARSIHSFWRKYWVEKQLRL